jgi:ABC-type uncharacterized transport system ATPase component
MASMVDEDEDDEVADEDKTPFIIVTGSLGAGKSTLINYMLAQQEQRSCVLINEYGERLAHDTVMDRALNVTRVQVRLTSMSGWPRSSRVRRRW